MSAKARPRRFRLISLLFVFCAPGMAWGQSDACAFSRAVVAGEIALNDALSRMDGNAAPLRGALARLASGPDGTDPPSEVAAYLESRSEIATALSAEGVLAARRLARAPQHREAGQAALSAARAGGDCGGQTSGGQVADASDRKADKVISGGHGGLPQDETGPATGAGRTSQPGGGGMATSPLSFLRDFDMKLHIAPAIGATLAFGALIFALSRDRRRHRRYLCHMPLVVESKTGGAVESVLLDISQGGGKLVKKGAWPAGAALNIRFAAAEAPYASRVMWANKGFVGVSFRKTLTKQEFQQLLKQARASGGAAMRERA